MRGTHFAAVEMRALINWRYASGFWKSSTLVKLNVAIHEILSLVDSYMKESFQSDTLNPAYNWWI